MKVPLEPMAGFADGRRQLHLVGFMGAGKSTVGRLVARAWLWNFLDLDALIERQAGRSIEDIFAQHGEAAFRDLEADVLRQAVHKPRAVVALGGGAFATSDNRRVSGGAAVSVWLRCDLATVRARIGTPSGRPLWGDEQDVAALLRAREPTYALADVAVDAEGAAAEVADRVVEALARFTTGC